MDMCCVCPREGGWESCTHEGGWVWVQNEQFLETFWDRVWERAVLWETCLSRREREVNGVTQASFSFLGPG